MSEKSKTGRIREEVSRFLDENQDPKVVEEIHRKVSDILTTNEQVVYICVQKKPIVNPRPDALVLTNRRFIVYRPKILGRVTFEDYVWRNLRDAHLEEGLLGATITMATTKGNRLTIGYLPKIQARKVYALAQEHEERVHEERRRRELEDKRAAAGGIVMNQKGETSDMPSNSAQDPVERLKKLKEMMDAELLTPGEYEAKRAEILAEM